MRLIKFIAAFLIPAVLVFLIAFGWNWKSTKLFFDNRESMAEGSEWVDKTYSLSGLAQYIEQNPENVSFASFVQGDEDAALAYHASERRTMGVMGNIFLMIGVAEMIADGMWELDEQIPFREFDRYQLPDVSESSHSRANMLAEERGWVINGSVSLGNSMLLLAESGSLAIADYLWWRLGSDYFEDLSKRLMLEETDMPLPFSGIYLMISPEIEARSAINSASEHSDLERNRTLYEWLDLERQDGNKLWRSQVELISKKLLDDEFRSYAEERLDREGLGLRFTEMRDALALFPQTTAREVTDLLRRFAEVEEKQHQTDSLDEDNRNLSSTIDHDSGIRSDVGSQVLYWLRWPMVNHESAKLHFSDYGALYDDRMGLLNGLDIGTSKYTGKTKIQAVFFDRLEIAFWFHMSSNHMHQDFQQRMNYDPAMIGRLERFVKPANVH